MGSGMLDCLMSAAVNMQKNTDDNSAGIVLLNSF
jgi:hypothetical protein